MPNFDFYPSRTGAPGSINVSTLNGRIVPNFDNFFLSETDRLHYFIGAIETRAPLTTGGQPRQYAAVNKSVLRLEDGAITDDLTNFQSTHDAFNSVVQGMVIFDVPNDAAPSTFTQGTAGLIISFGNGNPDPDNTTFEGVYYRHLSTDSGTPWTAATEATLGTTYLTCWQMAKAGPDLYAVCDAGVSVASPGVGDYKVSKCPAGNNPILVASWGNGIEVGTPEWIITGLSAIGDAPVAGKPDGLYYYDLQKRRFENVLKHFELVPHALNGKVTQAVTGGVVYTTAAGGCFFFDGVAVQEISPSKLWEFVGKDIGAARITAVADRGDAIAMITDAPVQTTQLPGLTINKVTSAGAATDMTTNLIDGSLNTGSGTTLDSLASGSFIDIWADIPFEGVVFHVTRSPNSTVTALFDQVSYSSATDTFTADTDGFYDGTRLTGGSLSYVNYPPSASAGVVMGKSPNFGSLMQAINFNYSSGTDITGKYGMRIRTTGTFDSDVEIDEVEIIPWRTGMPNGGIYATGTNHTNRDRAGCIPHVYILKRQNTTGFVAHDSYAIDCGPGVWAMSYHSGRAGRGSGESMMGQSLVGWGRFVQWQIPEGPTKDVARTPYPSLSYVHSSNPGPLLQICHDWRGRPSESTKLKTLNAIHIDTEELRPVDQTEIFAQFDGRDIISLGMFEGGPIHLTVGQGMFRRLNLWLGMSLTFSATRQWAPRYLEPIIIEYSVHEGVPPQDPVAPIPAAV